MTRHTKELLTTLSNDQLIYFIEQMYHSLFLIGETCTAASKCHIEPEDAIRDIREDIYLFPTFSNEKKLKDFLDFKMGKITIEEYRKRILGE